LAAGFRSSAQVIAVAHKVKREMVIGEGLKAQKTALSEGTANPFAISRRSGLSEVTATPELTRGEFKLITTALK
jgi:hypothetical protein